MPLQSNMEQIALPVLSECVIAFDLDLHKYLTIGPCIGLLAGYPQGSTISGQDFWSNIIHPDDADHVHQAYSKVTIDNALNISYRLNAETEEGSRYITEKRSIYIDSSTGHHVLFSVLNEHAAGPRSVIVQAERSAKEDALKREQFLLSLINSQTNFLIRLDRKGRFTFVNKRYCQVFGYNEDELIGRHFSINTAPEDMERCEAAFVRCVSNPGTMIPLVRSKLDKTGEKHPTEWEFISITDEHGNVTEIQGVGQDISQRIRFEQQMRETAEKLDSFMESITDSFFIVDNQWRFLRMNNAFEILTGLERCRATGEVIWDVLPKIVNTEFEQEYRQAAETRKTAHFSLYFKPLKKWLRSTVYPSADGLTVFIRDITEQRIAEEQLNNARANLESLINNTTDLIWSVDVKGRYIYTNNAYKNNIEKATGNRPVDGTSVSYEGYGDDITAQWKAYYARAFNGEQYAIVNDAIDPFRGVQVYFEVSFNPIFNSGGHIVGVGCFAHDITRRLQYENEIVLQNERLRQIASLSSHELRRPVASMLGLINIIDMDDFSNPENKEVLRLMHAVTTEIDEVIRQIVDNAFTGRAI